MKYILNYKDGDWCQSDFFKNFVDNDNYIAISDEDFESLLTRTKVLTSDNTLIDNPNPMHIIGE